MWKDTLRAAGATALLLATAGSAQAADLTSDLYGERRTCSTKPIL